MLVFDLFSDDDQISENTMHKAVYSLQWRQSRKQREEFSRLEINKDTVEEWKVKHYTGEQNDKYGQWERDKEVKCQESGSMLNADF